MTVRDLGPATAKKLAAMLRKESGNGTHALVGPGTGARAHCPQHRFPPGALAESEGLAPVVCRQPMDQDARRLPRPCDGGWSGIVEHRGQQIVARRLYESEDRAKLAAFDAILALERRLD